VPTMQILAIVVSTAIATAPPLAADPFDAAPETAAPTTNEPVTDAAPEPAPAPTPAPIPGVPAGVDLDDEATWSELSPEQKDRLRAIRAEQRYQAVQAGQAPRVDPAYGPARRSSSAEADEIAELRAEHRRMISRADARWADQDNRLVAATAATGALWAVGVAVTVGMAVGIERKVDACADEVSSDPFSNADSCSEVAGRSTRRLAVGTYVVGSITGVLAVGFLVSGILLGVHRSNRPQWAVAGGRARLAISRGGLRLRF